MTEQQNNERGLAQRRRGEAGQAMVEFAFVVPILVLITFAAIQFGDAYWKFQRLSAAASEGARKAAVSRSDTNRTTTITDAVKNASDLNTSKVSVSISSTWVAGSDVTVTATYNEPVSFLGVDVVPKLESRRTMRVEQ